ncbi:MAG: thioredoxin family protein [Bacteroidales bacterium]|nr:thioredoxin family protein [Bacteroidales bacterium]
MKKRVSILISMLICLGMAAQNKGVNFESLTLQEALSKAKSFKKSPKLIFIDCYTSWCGPCKDMTNNVFPQEVCGDFFNANFVNLKFDMEKGEGVDISKKYAVSVYPTFLILDTEGNEINRVIGSDKAEPFIEKVKLAMNPSNSPAAKFEVYNRDKSSENLYAYVAALQSSYKYNELNSFIDDVFFSLKPDEKYSERIWSVLTSPTGAMCNTNSEIFRYVLLNKFEADRYVTKSKVDDHLIKTFKIYLKDYISGNLPKEMISNYETNVICANILSNNDFGIEYLIRMAALKNENKIDELLGMLVYRRISRGSSLDIEMIEKSFSENRSLTPDQKAKVAQYFNEKFESLSRDAAYAKRNSERLNQ